jgi:hypothetical protein
MCTSHRLDRMSSNSASLHFDMSLPEVTEPFLVRLRSMAIHGLSATLSLPLYATSRRNGDLTLADAFLLLWFMLD